MDSEVPSTLSRPSSCVSQPILSPSSVLDDPGEAMQTVTPRNVREWTEYQASMNDLAQGGYDTAQVIRPVHRQTFPAYSSSYVPTGLGIGQPPLAYRYGEQAETRDAMPKEDQVHTRPSPLEATSGNIFGLSPSSHTELGSPLTWSPDSGHTDGQPKNQSSIPTPPTPPTGLLVTRNTVSHSSSTPEMAFPEMEDNDATLKRHSYNSVQIPGSYFSDESSLGIRSTSNSPAPLASSGNVPRQWRRAPLPFSRSTTPAVLPVDISLTNLLHVSASMLSQSLPTSLSQNVAGPPQVTLSPALHEDNTSVRSWSPQNFLHYPSDARSMPLQQPSYLPQFQPHERSVSPQHALLAPFPVHAGHSYAGTANRLFPETSQDASTSVYRDRHCSSTSSTSAANLGAFRPQHQMPYRELHSPLGSSVGSYHSESTDECDVASQSGGASRTGASGSPSGLSFTAESPYPSQVYFEGMQIAAQGYIPDCSTSATSDGGPPHSQFQASSSGYTAQHPSLKRSTSLNVARRPLAVRHFSHHPYYSGHPQYFPELSIYRREDSYSPATVDAPQSAPDLSQSVAFDASMYLRTPSPLDQPGNWNIPTEEELRLAAMQYRSPNSNHANQGDKQDGRTAYSDIGLHEDSNLHFADTNQETLGPRRTTPSHSKSTPIARMFNDDNQDYPDVSNAQASASSTGPDQLHTSGRSSHPATITLLPLERNSASGRYDHSRGNGPTLRLSQGLLPWHMLPTKRSRGRRPVISPDLDIDPTIDSTTASTLQQVSFTGVTKTGKPKKIFVCRVPGCDKCFRRSEHLKRHIRSIHTHDKRECRSFA